MNTDIYNKIIKGALASLLLIAPCFLTSCDEFLDEMPDNRTTIDNEKKVKDILTGAYPDHEYAVVCEYSSDNVDEFNNTNGSSNRWFMQMGHWEDITETFNEGPNNLWTNHDDMAVAANMALEGIEELGGPTNTLLTECKGEALVCRAYAHFMLANIFCKAYDPATAGDILGVYYQYGTGTEVGVINPRGNLQEVYDKIEADLLEGLPLLGDSHYDHPKYHFNKKAAYAFASRFFLYAGKWEECIKYANLCLGEAPKTMLRDWVTYATYATSGTARPLNYVSTDNNCNLLVSACYSRLGTMFLNYNSYKHFAHGQYINANETFGAQHIWGKGSSAYIDGGTSYYPSGNDLGYCVARRCPYLFEYTDPVAGTGYTRTIFPAFTADDCLLERAEAYIHLKQYNKACEDMNLWMHNYTKNDTLILNPDTIQRFYSKVGYCYEITEEDQTGMVSTIKKHLHPVGFTIEAEGSVDECMYQCLLDMRRIETIHRGLRWFDIKRFGMEIKRRMMENHVPGTLVDVLKSDDERKAIQVPQQARDAGVTPNPR